MPPVHIRAGERRQDFEIAERAFLVSDQITCELKSTRSRSGTTYMALILTPLSWLKRYIRIAAEVRKGCIRAVTGVTLPLTRAEL